MIQFAELYFLPIIMHALNPCNCKAPWVLCLFWILAISGCEKKSDTPLIQRNQSPVTLENSPLIAAKGFTFEHQGNNLRIHVHRPWQGAGAQGDFIYDLISPHENVTSNKNSKNHFVIQIPIQRIISLTTTNLPHFESFGTFDKLVGVGGGKYICNPHFLDRLKNGSLQDVGAEGQMDLEAVVGLKPDLIFTFVVGNSNDGIFNKLLQTQIPLAIDGSYMEETPLGRAEWIKFTAAFLDQETKADSIFNLIDSNYKRLVVLAQSAQHKPTVMVNGPFGGIWWMPGGKNYFAQFLSDAGADYIWAQDTTYGSLNLDLETVLTKGGKAEFWLNPGDWKNLNQGLKRDLRNAYFYSFQKGNVYNNDAIVSASGGNDFYETGASRPDLILAELIGIFHPELISQVQKLGQEFSSTKHWYRKLPKS